MRRFEQRTVYGESGIADEWHSWEPESRMDTSGWTEKEFREFVRRTNAQAKARGDNTRIRSVEDEVP